MDILRVCCQATWLWRPDTSSPAWSPVGITPAPEGKGVEQAEGSEPGVAWGQLGIWGSEWKGICLPNACLATLPGTQSELHPAPPSFPWKHGSKGKGVQQQPNSSPPPLQKKFGTMVPIFCVGRSRPKPYMPLNSSLSGPPSPASGVFFNLAEEWQHPPPSSPSTRTQCFYSGRIRNLAEMAIKVC